MLLSDEIERYVKDYQLLDEESFKKENLKPAGYLLTVGEKYAMNGKVVKLDRISNEIVIKPFECAIIGTAEKIKMPNFLIGRWNLRVSMVYKGLLWLGALQVDPGYEGYLFGPIFNLSNKSVTFKLGEAWALIDFVKTTEFKEGVSKEYQHPPERKVIEDYNIKLRSGLFSEVSLRINKMEKNIDNFENYLKDLQSNVSERLNRVSTTVFTVLGILIASLSIIITLSRTYAIVIDSVSACILSVFAIIIATFALFKSKKAKKYQKGDKNIIEHDNSPNIKTLININLFKKFRKKKKNKD